MSQDEEFFYRPRRRGVHMTQKPRLIKTKRGTVYRIGRSDLGLGQSVEAQNVYGILRRYAQGSFNVILRIRGYVDLESPLTRGVSGGSRAHYLRDDQNDRYGDGTLWFGRNVNTSALLNKMEPYANGYGGAPTPKYPQGLTRETFLRDLGAAIDYDIIDAIQLDIIPL